MMHAEPAMVTGGKHVMLYAALGLACMFGGIWLGDAEIIGATNLPEATLAMRVCSAVVYALFFVIAQWYAKRKKEDLRWLFGVAATIGIACFVLGAVLVFALAPDIEDAQLRQMVMLGGLYLTKVIGAPLSVSLTCVFALLDRTAVMRACALGMLGAFAFYSLIIQAVRAGGMGAGSALVVAGGLLTCASLCAMVGLGGPVGKAFRIRQASPRIPAAFVMPGVVKRPMKKVLTPGFVIIVILAALMLGFLRNGFGGEDPHANPVSFVMLIVLVAVAAFWKGLRTEHIFYGALLCTAMGVLLAPVFAMVLPGIVPLASGLGTALFEVVMWSLVVWAARNSEQTLLAASLARLVAVCGHLLGTMLVVGVSALLVGATPDEALSMSEFIILFIYVVLLIVLLKFPQLQVPFMSPTFPVEEPEAASSVPDEQENSSAEDVDLRYWVEPCDVIAKTYQLTAREREVLELMARGRDMPFMEEALFVSRNTVKMHIRHIYTKLDVHSKQDIIDMVEQIRR